MINHSFKKLFGKIPKSFFVMPIEIVFLLLYNIITKIFVFNLFKGEMRYEFF